MPPQDGCFVLDVPAHGVTRRTTRQSLAIARGLLRAGDLARAEQAFLQIARQDPLSGETRFFLGLIHQQRKDLETAIHHYEHALRLAPGLAEARNNLGVILQSR
ncbi:MAG: tetratricopeptide repeat protein, partial [Isosphaeraceae bacterium]